MVLSTSGTIDNIVSVYYVQNLFILIKYMIEFKRNKAKLNSLQYIECQVILWSKSGCFVEGGQFVCF